MYISITYKNIVTLSNSIPHRRRHCSCLSEFTIYSCIPNDRKWLIRKPQIESQFRFVCPHFGSIYSNLLSRARLLTVKIFSFLSFHYNVVILFILDENVKLVFALKFCELYESVRFRPYFQVIIMIIRPPSLTVVLKIEKKFDIKTRYRPDCYTYKRIFNQVYLYMSVNIQHCTVGLEKTVQSHLLHTYTKFADQLYK